MLTGLIDTNLLIYLYDKGSPEKSKKAKLVLGKLDQQSRGCLSVQNLAEFLSVSTRKLDPPLSFSEALDQVDLFIQMWSVLDLTTMVVLEAARGCRDHGLSYYDAQIWATARLNQVPVVFSEDFTDGQVLDGVRFVNPFSRQFRLEDWF